MSRTGVTYVDVAEAAETLTIQGETPTIDKIRSFLGGTGSNTTISKYLNTWREQVGDKTESTLTSDPVKAAVERVWQQIRTETETEIAAIQAEAQVKVSEAETKAKSYEEKYNNLLLEQKNTQEQLYEVQSEKELLALELKKIQQQQEILNERYQGLENRCNDLQQIHAQHLKDFTHAHQQEIKRLEELRQQEKQSHQRLIDELKNQHEIERHQHMNAYDALKVEYQKISEQIKTQEIKEVQVRTELDLVNKERDELAHQYHEQEKKWELLELNHQSINEINLRLIEISKLNVDWSVLYFNLYQLLHEEMTFSMESIKSIATEFKDTVVSIHEQIKPEHLNS